MKLDYYTSPYCGKLIIQYEHIQSENTSTPVIDRHIPSGYASIVFNLAGQAAIHEDKRIDLPPYFIVTPLLRSINIGIHDNLESFIVTCRASILSRLLSIDLSLTEGHYYRDSNDQRLTVLSEKISQSDSPSERINHIEHFFKGLGLIHYQPDAIDSLYDQIINGRGCTPITPQIVQLDRSPRYFRKHFIQRIGVNAKTLARIVRVNYLWSMILQRKAIDFQDIIFEADYFDQAHLIHDFKKIVGETPSFFFKRNLENVMLISGKV